MSAAGGDLREWAAGLPEYTGARVRTRRWGKYYEIADTLMGKGYPCKDACAAIARREGLGERDEGLLYQAIRNWLGRRRKKNELQLRVDQADRSRPAPMRKGEGI